MSQQHGTHLGPTEFDTASANATWPPDLTAAPARPSQIGDYRIIEQVGSGGMGIVYKAQQLRPVQRTVALKLIKLGMDTPQVVARFQSERQALAVLEHPGIARVCDAGATESGRPYFVMEFVQGLPITDYCDNSRLTTTQRLRLFEMVCHAVQHAHYKGILHRDLKPSNILVTEIDGQPHPKVIDFGVAKAIEESRAAALATFAGQLIGTPLYMSPEQASGGDLDTRADVYSLGMVLYELLSGSLPFDPSNLRGADSNAVARRIIEFDPRKPSTHFDTTTNESRTAASQRGADVSSLFRQLRGDPDRIVMKAIDKDRTQRYGTAAALAEDVRRYLAHEPILARPPTLSYQARKFARRNRVFVSSFLIVALAIFFGGVAATIGLVRARQALAEARASQQAAQHVNQFLADMLASVNPERAQGEKVLVRDVLDRAQQDVGPRFARQPLAAAALHAIIGNTYHALGLPEPARAHWQSTVELRRNALGAEHPETLNALNSLATSLKALGRRPEAEAILRDLLPLRRPLAGAEHSNTLIAEESLGLLLAETERAQEADPLLRHVLDARRRTLGPDHPDTLLAMNNMLAVAEQLGRNAEAVEINRTLVAARERVLGPNHPSTIQSMTNLATTLLKQKKPAEAEPILLEALARNERVVGPDHERTFGCMNSLAVAYRLQGRLSESESMNREVLVRLRRSLPENHPHLLTSLGNLALVLEEQQKIDEALSVYRELHERARSAERAGTIPPTQSYWMIAPYGERLVKYGRYDQAESPLIEALRALDAAEKKRSKRGIELLEALAVTYEHTHKPQDAARYRAEAADLRAAAQRAGVKLDPRASNPMSLSTPTTAATNP